MAEDGVYQTVTTAIGECRIMNMWIGAAVTVMTAYAAPLACSCAKASTFKVLHSFSFSDPGFFPTGDLILDGGGDVIGTTATGSQAGTVFRFSTATGATTLLYSFQGATDGSKPQGSLVLQGNLLYGTAAAGGPSNDGTVYQLDLSSLALTTLYAFTGGADGADPYGGLRAYGGSFFGAALFAGNRKGGTLFEISTKATKAVILHAFGSKGSAPNGPFGNVAVDRVGVVYGVTEAIGKSLTGSLYSFDTASNTFKVLHAFTEKTTGEFPFAGVTLFQGSLYGTTFKGGAHQAGTVWRFDLSTGLFAVLHSFVTRKDGKAPQARLTITKSGVLYGTAYSGGAYNYGTVFKIDLRNARFSVIHNFGGSDGEYPLAGVIVANDRTIYGTTSLGGAGGAGELFEIAR